MVYTGFTALVVKAAGVAAALTLSSPVCCEARKLEVLLQKEAW